MIAKKRQVEQFVSDVDTLRDDVERLNKRFEKLAKGVQSLTNTTATDQTSSTETPKP